MEIKDLVTVVPSSTDLVPVSVGEDTRNCKVSDLWDIELRAELEEARGTHDDLNSRLDADKTDALTREIESTGCGVISGLTVAAQITPNMTVSIATGIVHMPNGVRLAPLARSALTINAADTTNPRKDIIHVNSDSTIGYTPGISSSSPVAPTVPVGSFLLAEITVGANVTTITNLNIADKRKLKNSTDSLATQLSEKAKKGSPVEYDLALSSGYTGTYAKYSKDEFNKVLLTFQAVIKSDGSNFIGGIIGQLPVGFIPSRPFFNVVTFVDTGGAMVLSIGRLIINTDGTINIIVASQSGANANKLSGELIYQI